jgi:hypothetical protein
MKVTQYKFAGASAALHGNPLAEAQSAGPACQS